MKNKPTILFGMDRVEEKTFKNALRYKNHEPQANNAVHHREDGTVNKTKD